MTRGRSGVRRIVSSALAGGLFVSLAVTAGLVAPAGAADTEGKESAAPVVPLRLGSLLPGEDSSAIAIDGDIVVGKAVAGYGPREETEFDTWYRPPLDHAVAWDLRDPVPLDLGTLGGAESEAADVDGRWVVGSSQPADQIPTRAFAVDVADVNPTMIDLGTLPGHVGSMATAVDDGIVVGSSYGGGSTQAFAFDLNIENPRMVHLGNLGDSSYATDVEDGVVVGTAFSKRDNRHHAFAVDLNASEPTIRDLGNLGAESSGQAGAVDGRIVVGPLYSRGLVGIHDTEAFALDLATDRLAYLGSGAPEADSWAVDVENGIVVGHEWDSVSKEISGFVYDVHTESRRDLGVLGGYLSQVVDIDDDGMLAGVRKLAGAEEFRAFAADATSATPILADRGSLGDADVTAADKQVLVGTLDGQAAAWPIGETLRIRDSAVAVHESADAARVRVLRTGDLSEAASVRYRTTGDTARPERDFRPVTGTVAFAPGQSQATISVPLIDDAHPERREQFTLRLTDPTPGQRLLMPRTTIAIPASDQRPDAEIATTSRRGYVGNDIYNSTGRRQTKGKSVRRGGTGDFSLRVRNDGNATITVAIRPRKIPDDVRVSYFGAGQDVTAAVTGPGGWETTVRSDRQLRVRVEVSVHRSVPAGASRTLKVASIWSGDRTRLDVVGASLKVRS